MTVATTIYLKRRDLVAHKACADGLALFDELAASQGRKRDMQRDEPPSLRIVRGGRRR